jgi:hypothetical protein
MYDFSVFAVAPVAARIARKRFFYNKTNHILLQQQSSKRSSKEDLDTRESFDLITKKALKRKT